MSHVSSGPRTGPTVHHIALRVEDPERAARLYGGFLGLEEVRRLEDASGVRALWLRAGDTILMLERERRGRGEPAGSGHLLAFRVHDLARWSARIEQAGLTVDDRTEHTLFLRDPDGHRVGLSDYPFEG